MPSAEPARDDHAAPGLPGTVINFGRRSTTRTGRGRRTPHPPVPERAVADTPQQRLAETAEAFFLARGMTLTDEDTADAYRATLDFVTLMHDGTLAEGLVGEGEHRHLAAMVAGMREAPDGV